MLARESDLGFHRGRIGDASAKDLMVVGSSLAVLCLRAEHESMKNRNRLDHYVPQGYLEGFIGPSGQGQLSVFDREGNRWFESGTARIEAIKGFYDYSEGSKSDQTADEAFRELETLFPEVRRELIKSGFVDWKKWLEILLRFGQMLRARSLLFREQSMAQSQTLTFLKVEEILPPEPSKTEPGKLVTPIRYSPYVPAVAELKNKTITEMRVEIDKGTTWMSDMHWCLRVTKNADDPFVTCDTPLVMEGRVPQDDALKDWGTLIFFPLCWQACLVGSPAKFDIETDAATSSDMRKFRALYLKSASRFVFSPIRIDWDGRNSDNDHGTQGKANNT